MKVYLPSIVLVGLIIMMILQGVLFTSTSLQNQHLQKQITEITKKIDTLQNDTNNILSSISKLSNNPTVSDIQKIQDSQLLSESDPNNLLSEASLSQTLGTETSAVSSPTPSPTVTDKKIKLKNGWKDMDVYESAHSGSRTVGKITNKSDYPVIQKQVDWYQIKLDTQNAWVQAKFVYETN